MFFPSPKKGVIMAVNINQPNAFSNMNQSAQGSSNVKLTGLGMRSNFRMLSETEHYNKLLEKLVKKITELNKECKDREYKVTKIFKNEEGLRYSGIAISTKKDNLVYCHTLVVEKTGEYPEPYVANYHDNINMQRIEILRTPSDAFDATYEAYVRRVVAQEHHVSTDMVLSVDSTLIPNEFDYESEEAVTQVVFNTTSAIDMEIYFHTTPEFFNIPSVNKAYPNGKFVINMVFNDSAVVKDAVGMPVREDICLSLSFKIPSGNQNRSINSSEVTYNIVKVYGYIDFDFVAPVQTPMGVMTQKFVPNFVITHIEAVDLLPSPDVLMLGIACVNIVNDDMNWLQAFRPRATKKGEINYNDIGALNIEGNIEGNPSGNGALINTSSKEFTILELNTLVQKLVRPGFSVSIDIPQMSPDTWYMSILNAAANDPSSNAYKRLIDSINGSTNGAFSAIAGNQTLPIFKNVMNKIHGGYFETRERVHDIRDITSYLAVANYIAHTGQNTSYLIEYTNSLYNMNYAPEVRAAMRKRVIEMINPRNVYKQMYSRYYFNAQFFKTLVQSYVAAGFAPVFGSATTSNDIFHRRSSADLNGAIIENDIRLMNSNMMFPGYRGIQGYQRMY
jgi:hypothetical protein